MGEAICRAAGLVCINNAFTQGEGGGAIFILLESFSFDLFFLLYFSALSRAIFFPDAATHVISNYGCTR